MGSAFVDDKEERERRGDVRKTLYGAVGIVGTWHVACWPSLWDCSSVYTHVCSQMWVGGKVYNSSCYHSNLKKKTNFISEA